MKETSPLMWLPKGYFVYIMSSQRRVLYVGVTNNLVRRAFEHKTAVLEGFSSKYKATQLVYYESLDDVRSVIHREKEIKGWVRRKKIELIEAVNPKWKDLSLGWYNPQSDEKLRKIFSSRNRMGPKGAL
jgi:putative endonuclease